MGYFLDTRSCKYRFLPLWQINKRQLSVEGRTFSIVKALWDQRKRRCETERKKPNPFTDYDFKEMEEDEERETQRTQCAEAGGVSEVECLKYRHRGLLWQDKVSQGRGCGGLWDWQNLRRALLYVGGKNNDCGGRCVGHMEVVCEVSSEVLGI